MKKSLQKNTHSHRHHAIISKLSCHHIPGIPLTFHQNIPLTLHYLHLSQLCFAAPRWYTQTICHAWATCPQQARSRGQVLHSIVIPRKKCPPPPKKKKINVGELLLASQHYIYLYMYIYIIYLVVSTPIEKNMLVK